MQRAINPVQMFHVSLLLFAVANVLRVPVIRLVALRRYITARSGLVPYGSFVIGWCGFLAAGLQHAFTRLPYCEPARSNYHFSVRGEPVEP